MHHQKQQSALEFISVYSWAILIVALFLGIIAVLALSKTPVSNLSSACNIQPSLPCLGSALSYNAINPLHLEIIFVNNLGVTMSFPSNGFNVSTTNVGSPGLAYNIGNCTPSIALQGTPVICQATLSGTLTPQTGSQATTLFTFSYQLCKNNNPSSCQGTIYKSTGTSLQTVALSNTGLYKITFQTNTGNGGIVINGVTYVNNVISYFTAGTYNAFAVPPPSYSFSGWSISSPSSTLSTTLLQATVLTLNSNAVLTASFAPSIGILLTTPTISSPNTIVTGGSATLTTTWSRGTPTYTTKWYSGPSSTCTSDTTLLATYPGLNAYTNSITVTPGSSTYYCSVVTDSATIPSMLSSPTTLVTVTTPPPITAVTLIPSNYVVDSGQTEVYTGVVTGGTPSYTYTYYNITGTKTLYQYTFVPSTTDSYAFTIGAAAGSFTYNLMITDSYAKTGNSIGNTIVVHIAQSPAALTVSNSIINAGGVSLLTANPSGGTPPYTINYFAQASCGGASIGTGASLLVSPTTTTTYSYNSVDSASTNSVACSPSSTVTVSGAIYTILSVAPPANALPTYAGSFNGVSSYITLPGGQTLLGATPTSGTVSLWANMFAYPANTVQYQNDEEMLFAIAKTQGNGYSDGYNTIAITIPWNNHNTFWWALAGTGEGGVSVGTASLNQWYLLTLTFNSVGGEVYINGAPVGAIGAHGTITLDSNPGYISYWHSGAPQDFNGVISNVQLYNTALSAGQVANLYSEGIGGTPIASAGNIGWWSLNNNANDGSGSGNNGAATNVAYTANYLNSYIVPVSNVALDIGQSITLTGATTDTATPYSYNYIISNAITSAILASTLYSSCSLTKNTLIWTPAAAWAGNVVNANVIVKDNSAVTSNSVDSGNIIINSALSPSTITPASPTIDNGQCVALNSNPPFGGTSPYTYNWYTGVGCTTPVGVYTSTYTPCPTSLTTYYYKVGDSAKVPTSACSAGDPVTVNSILYANVITPTSPSIDLGQPITLTSNAAGGSPPYTVYWYSQALCSGTLLNTGTSYTFSPTTSNTYYYKVVDQTAAFNCISTGDTVTVDPTLFANSITPPSATIDSGMGVLLTSNAAGGTPSLTINWFSQASCGGASQATGTTYTPSPASTTTYTYNVVDSAYSKVSQCSANDVITVNPVLLANAITPASPKLDLGQSVTLTANPAGGSPAYTINWYIQALCSGAVVNTGSPYAFTPIASNTYYYKVTDQASAFNCLGTGDILTVNSVQVVGLLTESNTVINSGGVSLLTAAATTGGTPPYTYNWFNAANCGGTNIGSGSTLLVNPASTTIYSFNSVDSASTKNVVCSASNTVTVSGVAAPIYTIISSSPPANAIPTYVVGFNGVSTNITAGYGASLNLQNAFTLTGWVYYNGLPQDDAIMYKVSNPSAFEPQYGLGASDQNVGGGTPTSDTSVFYGTASTRYNTAGYAVSPNTWMQQTATYDGSTIKLYMNGVYTGVSSSVSAPIDSSSTGNLIFGSRPVSSYMWFNGLMSDFQIYNIALTPAQVSSLYAEGIGGTPLVPASTAGWWKFNGDANDYSGNGNNGMNFGTTNVIYPSNYIANYIVPTPNVALDIGQSITFTGATTDTVSPYSYNYIISNSVTNAQISSNLFTSCTLTTNTFVWTPASSLIGNTVQGNVIVKDNSAATSNSVKSGIITINPALQTAKAANFNNILNSYIQMADTGLPFGNSARSVFVWVYITSKGDAYTVHEYGITQSNGPNQQSNLVADCSTGTCYPRLEMYTSNDFDAGSLTIPLNTWTLVGYTYNGVAGTLYVNTGSYSQSFGPLITASSGYAYLGLTDWEWGNWFPGAMSNLQIYNTALTPIQEASLYAAGMGGTPVLPSSLVGWFPLNGNSIDYSGSGNNGADSNMAYVSSITASNAPTVTAGQYELFQASWIGGTSPYSANFVVSNTVTGTVLTSQLYTGITGTSNSLSYQIPGAWVGNTIAVNVVITDSASNPMTINSVKSNTITVASSVLPPIYTILTVAPPANALPAYAGSFNGVSSYITLPGGQTLLGATPTSGTVSLWANMFAYPANTVQYQNDEEMLFAIAKTQGNGYSDGYNTIAITIPWNNHNTFWWALAGTGEGGVSVGTASLNQWYLLTLTFNSVGGEVYINGAPVGAIGAHGTITLDSNPGYISYWHSGAPQDFNGVISNVQLYNTALSAGQVANLYSEGIGGTPIASAGNIGWWSLNNNANDGSGSGNNGAATNVAYTANYLNSYIVPVSNVALDIGQSITLTGATTDTATPYSYNYIISNAITSAILASTLYSSCSLTKNTLIWTPAAAWAGNVVNANVIVKDNSAVTSNSVDSGNVIINPALLSVSTANFNGINSLISIPATKIANTMSLSAWFYYAGDTGASEDIFAISSGDIFSPYVATSTHVLCADLEWYTNGHTYYCEGATVTPNTWYHLVITYDKVNIRGYVNGVAGTVTPNSLGFNGVSYSPYIGGIGQQVYWKGNLANIQLYNAVLTAGQISSLYAEGINGAPILPGNDVGWWPLNGNAVDLSGKGLTGTPTNVVFSSSSANSVTVTHGQNEFFQTTWTGGTPPYSANYVISNTVTKTVLASQLYSGIPSGLTFNTLLYPIPAAWAGNTITVNVIITDSASIPMTINGISNTLKIT